MAFNIKSIILVRKILIKIMSILGLMIIGIKVI